MRTLAVTFATVALLLVAVFVVVIVSVRDQVRQTVATNLESGQRLFADDRSPSSARAERAGGSVGGESRG